MRERGEVKLLLLPGAGRAARHLRIARWKLWSALGALVIASALLLAAGYRIADYLVTPTEAPWAQR